jgi:hypothetical protein
MTKPNKTHAALANSKGPDGKSKKSTRKMKGATSMPQRYVARQNSSESESSASESEYHSAMFAQVQMDPLPRFTVQNIFGPNSRPALDPSKTRWDKDRFGNHNPRPKIFEADAIYRANVIRQSANSWNGRSLVASPKDSLTFRTQEIRLSDDDDTSLPR